MSEEITFFIETATGMFNEQKYGDALSLCNDILQAEKNNSEALYLRARCRYMMQGDTEAADPDAARYDLMTAMTLDRKIFEAAREDINLRPLFLSVFQNDPLDEIFHLGEKDNYGWEPEPVKRNLEDLKQGMTVPGNYQAWFCHVKSVLGYVPRSTNPGSLYGEPVQELLDGFFETQEELLAAVPDLPDEERIEFLRLHSFITFKNEYLEETHSWGHLCEENIFSTEDSTIKRMTGATSVALYRKEFEYLSKDLKLPYDLYESWKESVFIAWKYFCLPQMKDDLKIITAQEPDNAEAHYYLAECLQCPENRDDISAFKLYERFIELSYNESPPSDNYFINENRYLHFAFEPSVMEAYAGMARIYLKQGDIESYEQYLLKAINMDRYHHAAPYLELAHFYLISGSVTDAMKYTFMYEDIFEARVRSFDFHEDYYAGHNESCCREEQYSTGRNWHDVRLTTMSDCLLLNNSRLQWRFRKYPCCAISLKHMVTKDDKLHTHKTRFETGFTDTRKLILNFYMNIFMVMSINDRMEEYYFPLHDQYVELYWQCVGTESVTWECFPGLKRFDRDDIIKIELFVLSRTDIGKLMDRIAELKKLHYDRAVLVDYMKEIQEHQRWVFNKKIKESNDWDDLIETV